MSQHIVVVGAGQAGLSLVTKLRAEGFDGRITMIGEEASPPYQRPPLSKAYLLGDMPLERMYLKPESFYTESGIDLKLGVPVTGVDASARQIEVGGEVMGYDMLALTTGAAPRRLPDSVGGGLAGVHVVRTLADVDTMEPEFAEGRRVLIVGGGYIGLEAAAVAAKKGLKVTIVEAAERILQRVAAPATSDYFRALHEGHGVEILEGTGLTELQGDGRVSGALLADGSTREVDFVIVGVGVTPGVTLAEMAGVAIDNGIATDAMGRTSDPHIWAAGDCASFPFRGDRVRIESVPNAIDQAECVAVNMLGAGRAYEAKPWFWSDQYDVKLQIAGLNAGYDRTVTRPGEKPGGQSVWYYAGGDLIAVDAMNDPRAYMIGKRMIEGGISPAPEAVADGATPLKSLLR